MSDKISLKYLFDQQDMNARQERWLDFLSEYDFKIKHIKRKENKVADVLRKNANMNCIAAYSSYKTCYCVFAYGSYFIFLSLDVFDFKIIFAKES